MGVMNPRNKLYYFDLKALLEEPLTVSAGTVAQDGISKRKTKISQVILQKVHRLHQQLNHRNFPSISAMIKNAILINIEKYGITSQDVDAVATHNDCMACALAKWKEHKHKERSGIHPLHPGNSWSFDY